MDRNTDPVVEYVSQRKMKIVGMLQGGALERSVIMLRVVVLVLLLLDVMFLLLLGGGTPGGGCVVFFFIVYTSGLNSVSVCVVVLGCPSTPSLTRQYQTKLLPNRYTRGARANENTTCPPSQSM